MAAVFLVTLYEYSPLFYITVVFVCFLVTSGLVLAWSGLGVPVILRNLEETESSARMLKKQMKQVKNPFGLEILHPATASVTSRWISDVLDFCQFGFLSTVLSVFLLSAFIKIPSETYFCPSLQQK